MTSDIFSKQNTAQPAFHPGISANHNINVLRTLENRSYGFKELAVLYFPNIAPASASIRLKQWIKDSPELLTSLAATHYHLTARILSPLQTQLIASTFGSPF